MNASQIYIAISVVVLAIVALLVFFLSKNKKQQKLTPLVGLAFGCIFAGILFVGNRLLSYSLIGVGVVVAVMGMIIKSKKK